MSFRVTLLRQQLGYVPSKYSGHMPWIEKPVCGTTPRFGTVQHPSAQNEPCHVCTNSM